MPIYESRSSIYYDIQNYFTAADSEDLTPLEKRTLSEVLNQMTVRDNRIEWIALYSDNREINYIKYSNSSVIHVITDSFPYLTDISSKTSQMEIYGTREIKTTNNIFSTFAICGGVPVGMGSGKIIIGYHLNTFESFVSSQIDTIPSARYYMISNNQVIFDSSGEYSLEHLYIPYEPQKGLTEFNSNPIYIKADYSGNSRSFIVYTADWNDIFLSSHQDTPWILGITLAFMIFSLVVHFGMNRSVSKEVTIIQEGLDIIADNHLDYRLPTNFLQGGLPEIAQNINEMSSRLNENIKKAYYFELKQKDAQLAQLQTTFNPHFLYNTLEMLRSKSYANGDEDTAELISDLAVIFRSFIGAKTFITLKEELAFTKKYLTLLSARYGDQLDIRYNIDSSLLNFGVIRNIFQVLIENYFIHGFDAGETDNFIRITGNVSEDHNILLTIEDNGYGMKESGIEALNKKIEEPIRHGKDSYGLKNLNQRLKLFYGPDYGLHVKGNDYGGLTIQIKIRKMNIEDYEELKVE